MRVGRPEIVTVAASSGSAFKTRRQNPSLTTATVAPSRTSSGVSGRLATIGVRRTSKKRPDTDLAGTVNASSVVTTVAVPKTEEIADDSSVRLCSDQSSQLVADTQGKLAPSDATECNLTSSWGSLNGSGRSRA